MLQAGTDPVNVDVVRIYLQTPLGTCRADISKMLVQQQLQVFQHIVY